ncbi:MAG: hypothetical protein PHD11_08385 [Bacteroidales bacterium]|nr:hypothetical protein [Bacteroidales bacterium]MDD4476519.1 hypothetical protein [Eubacteriales bacterium]
MKSRNKTILLVVAIVTLIALLVLLSTGAFNGMARQLKSRIYAEQDRQLSQVRELIEQSSDKYNLNPADTSAYILIKEAEKLYDQSDLSNYSTALSLKYMLGNCCKSSGNFNEALNYYRDALKICRITTDLDKARDINLSIYSIRKEVLSSDEVYRMMTSEMEWEYEYFKSQKEISEAKQRTAVIIIVAVALLLAVIAVLTYYVKITKKDREIARLTRMESEKTEIVKKILDRSSGLLPKFCERVYQIVVKYDGISSDTVTEINQAIDDVKKEYKDNVASYFIEDSLIRDNPLVAPLAELSAREKAVTLLIEQGYDTDYIAKILNTTQNGVRSSKRKALIKIRESAVIPEETKEYLIGILTRNRQ